MSLRSLRVGGPVVTAMAEGQEACDSRKAGIEMIASEDEVTRHAIRVVQLQDDARAQFDQAEEKILTLRNNLDRVIAGECGWPDEPAEAEPVPVVAPHIVVAPKRSRGAAIGLVMAGLAVVGGFAVSLNAATRDAKLAVAPVLTVTALAAELVALAVPVPGPVLETGSIGPSGEKRDDLGGLYAERFATAPAGERTCLARAVYFEARGEEMAGQIAVAQVVLNRARSKKWPDTICGVVNQGVERGEKCQFSFSCFTHLSQPSGEMWEQAQQVADQALRGQAWLRELVEATYYHTTGVAPVWRTGLTAIATIGTHIFYRDGDGLHANSINLQAYEAAAATQAARAKVATLTKAAKPKPVAGGAASVVKKAGQGSDWKASVFAN